MTKDVECPDIREDLRRLREFERTGEAVPFNEVEAWVESWGTAKELPRPQPRKMRWLCSWCDCHRIDRRSSRRHCIGAQPAPHINVV